MEAKFDLGGYAIQITQNGFLTSPDGNSGACKKGDVGIQVIHYPLPNGDESYPPKAIMQTFVKPSQARAIASALLSAATEARAIR